MLSICQFLILPSQSAADREDAAEIVEDPLDSGLGVELGGDDQGSLSVRSLAEDGGMLIICIGIRLPPDTSFM